MRSKTQKPLEVPTHATQRGPPNTNQATAAIPRSNKDATSTTQSSNECNWTILPNLISQNNCLHLEKQGLGLPNKACPCICPFRCLWPPLQANKEVEFSRQHIISFSSLSYKQENTQCSRSSQAKSKKHRKISTKMKTIHSFELLSSFTSSIISLLHYSVTYQIDYKSIYRIYHACLLTSGMCVCVRKCHEKK